MGSMVVGPDCFLAEFAVLSAAIGAELIAWALYTRAFELEYHFKWPVWLATPLAEGTDWSAISARGT